MARLTIEDCLEIVDNRYDMVMLAAKRARQIINGSTPMIDEDNDKPTVIALREIAEGLVRPDNINLIDAVDYDDEINDNSKIIIPETPAFK